MSWYVKRFDPPVYERLRGVKHAYVVNAPNITGAYKWCCGYVSGYAASVAEAKTQVEKFASKPAH